MFHDIFVLFTLSALEIVLGIDNLIFISLLVQRIPSALRNKICIFGLSLALLMRLVALFFVSSILSMDKTILSFLWLDISIKDCVLVIGGIFLSTKSFLELYRDVFIGDSNKVRNIDPKSKLILVVLQIVLIDLIFSIDSILTAIALTHNIVIITIAFMFSMLVMFFLSSHTTSLINSYPELKIVAILFIFAIGVYLILDGLHIELSQKYIYIAFASSLMTTLLNIVKRRNAIK
ncbi:MAG: TerC family protein [Wolbachia endosymbiont of Xenopsylla cheopis]